MPRVHRCPGCETALRIPDAKIGKVVTCPACGTRSRTSGETGGDPRPAAETGPGHGAWDEYEAPPPVVTGARKKRAASQSTLRPFLRRWLIVCGVVLAIAAAFGLAGLFWEPPAMAASLICVAAILACTLTGTVWMAIDFGRASVPMGIAVFLMPPIGLGLAFRDKGPARRGATVYASALAPALLLGLMLLAFLPRYTGAGQRAARADRWEALIHRLDDQLRPDTPTVSVTYLVSSRPGALAGLAPVGEGLLSRFECYVPGSFAVDAAAGTIAYQYRGPEQFHALFAFYLSSETGTFFPQRRVGANGASTAPAGGPGPPQAPATSLAPFSESPNRASPPTGAASSFRMTAGASSPPEDTGSNPL